MSKVKTVQVRNQYGTCANPPVSELSKWEAKGWQVVPETPRQKPLENKEMKDV